MSLEWDTTINAIFLLDKSKVKGEYYCTSAVRISKQRTVEQAL